MSKKKSSKIDGLLGEVYNECSGIGQELKFLHSIYSFLNRRSTYLAKPGSTKQVQQLINHYTSLAKKQETARQESIKQNQKKQQIEGELPKKNTSKDDDIKMKDISPQKKDEPKKVQPKKDEPKTVEPKKDETPKDAPKKDNDSDSDDDDTEKPIGNGGKTDKYTWTQTLSEVEVVIEIPMGLRGRNLDIKISKKHIKVAIVKNSQFGSLLLNGELHDEVDDEESTWTLDQEHGKNTKTLIITLFKKKNMTWWKRVIVGDAEINTQKIQPENSNLGDLDAETRQTVEKMMFDQQQKRKGLPTSKEMEHANILEKFKSQHPEMDFSNVKMG